MTSQFKGRIVNFFNNDLIRPIVKNAGYLFSAMGVSSVINMAQSILAGRLLGPSTFGILTSIVSFTSVVNTFASFRMNELVVRYVGHYQENNEPQRAAAVFKLAGLLEVGSSFFAYGLIFVLAPLGARYFAHDDSLVHWFRIYGTIILANMVYETTYGLLQIFDRFRFIAIIDVVQSILTLVMVAFSYFSQWGLVAVVIAYMSGKILGSVAISIYALMNAGRIWGKGWWRTPLGSLKSSMRSLITFAVSTNLSGTVSLIAKNSEILWVSAFLGTQQAGYYKTAMSLSGIIQLPITPLPKVTYPALTREIARKNWKNVRYVLRQGTLMASAFSIPVTLGLVLFGKWLIQLTYGHEFLPTYDPLVILLIGFTFVNIFYWNRGALLALARPVFPTIVNSAGMVIKVALIFLLVPRWGYIAFAALLSGYYIFTVGSAAIRVYIDLNSREANSSST